MPREQLTAEEQDRFVRGLEEYRASQSLFLDHAGGHLALGSIDRHLAARLRAVGAVGQAALLEQSAVEHWRSAIVVEPYIAGPRGELANALAGGGGDPTEIRRLREEEVKLLERDAQLAPDSGQIHYRLAMIHVLLRQYQEATDALREATRLMPTDYTSRMALALVYQERYQASGEESFYNAAVRELNALNQLNPRDPRAASIMRNLTQIREARQNSGQK
jgi:tetratricopeptide (TPR) repeat protein